MRAGIVVNVTRADRRRLEVIVSDRSAPQKHVWRAQIILATADGCGTIEIMRRSGKAKPVVWRWQQRFMAEGVDGLLRDKTRKPGKPPLPAATVQKVIDLVTGPPPGEATHWTGRILARAWVSACGRCNASYCDLARTIRSPRPARYRHQG
jgi:transposase